MSTEQPPSGGSSPPPGYEGPSGGNSNQRWLIAGGVFLAVVIIGVIIALVASGDDDDDAAADTTTTTAAEETTTTTAAEETTTTTAAEETTTTTEETTTTTTEAGVGGECAVENLNLVNAGVLTVATGETAFPPWVGTIDGENFDVPESQTGLESAVVYELARTLGFTDDQVVWERTGFDEVIAPGPKGFDFNVQQYTITEDRAEVVSFSDPYYVTTQALVVNSGSPFEGVTTTAELADAKLGAAIGTTSLDYIDTVIQPNQQAAVYDTNVDAITALDAGQIDGIIVDVPTAFFITAAQMDNGVIVGQFAAPAAQPDALGFLFEKDNPLVECVNAGLTILRDNGFLDAAAETWLASESGLGTIN